MKDERKTKAELIAELKKLRSKVTLLEEKETNPQKESKRVNFYQDVINAIADPVFVKDENHCWIAVNKALCNMIGFSEEEMIGKSDFDLFPKEQAQVFWDHDKKAFNSGSVDVNEEEIDSVNGRLIISTIKSVFINPATGKRNLVGTIRDITKQKKAEQRIQENEQRLRSLINSTPDIICFKDGKGRWLEANDADLDLFMLKDVNYFGKTDYELADYTHEIYKEAFRTCVVSDEKAWSADGISRGEEVIPKPNGEEKIYDVIKVPLYESDGSRKGLTVLGRDITSRKKIEAELEESQRAMKTLLGNLPGIAYRCKNVKTWEMIFISDGCKNLTGYLAEQIVHNRELPYVDIIHPEDREYVWIQIQNAIRLETFFRVSYRIKTQNGKIKWVWEQGLGIKGENGEVKFLEGFITDTTEQKVAEDKLRKSEQRFRHLAQNAQLIPWESQLGKWDFTYVGEQAEKILGFPVERWYEEQFWVNQIHPDDREHTLDYCIECSQKVDDYEFEYRMIAQNGGVIWVHDIVSVDRTRGPEGMLSGFMIDITARKQAEKALHDSEERFRAIFEQAAVGVAQIISETGAFVKINQRYADIVGYTINELEALSFQDITHPEDLSADMQHMRRLLEGQIRKFSMEKRYFHKNGSIVWVNLTVSPMWEVGEEPEFHIAVVEDITARKQAESEKQRLETHLRQQQKLEAIGTLAGGVAHEINNPITGIKNYAQLIFDRLEAESSLKRFAEGIDREASRVATIVSNLLTYARQDKETHSPAFIRDIVNDTISLIGTIVRRDQITLNVTIPDNLPKVKCRSQQIQQVVMNLLTNARDALNDRYPEYHENKIINVTVEPFRKKQKRWIRISVEDHGAGIQKSIKERLFDPFFTTKDRTKGTGLGLSISHGIVNDHHGSLTFETKKDTFTRFNLELPVDNGWSH